MGVIITLSKRVLRFIGTILMLGILISFTGIGEGPIHETDSPLHYEDIDEIKIVPDGYIHRPVIEFFTGLSCPECMNGPHQDLDKLWEENEEKEEVPFTFVVFHELNGGLVDDLATDESKERMRHYQPQRSGTPDAEFDGGYIRLGGLDTSYPVTYENAVSAVENCKTRYEREFDPLNPRQFLRNEFKFVELYVNQVFTGEGYSVSVQVHYLGMDTLLLSDILQGSLYVFMIEDNVTAYSTVLEENVANHNVFRGYAIEDEQLTLSQDEWYETIVEWKIPKDAKVPIKPGDISAVAVVYDLDDTDSQNGNQGNNANVPRAIQSATPKSSAYDLSNDIPIVEDITITYDKEANITAKFDDEDGISMAYVLYNTEAPNSSNWEYIEMTISGEELCDETGACYAYLDSQGTALIPMKEGETLYYMLLIYDGNATEGKTGMYSYKAERSSTVAARGSISLAIVLMVIGILLLVIAFINILRERMRKDAVEVQPEHVGFTPVSDGQTPGLGAHLPHKGTSKTMMLGIVILGILLISMGAVAAVLSSGNDKVPELEMRDVDGNEIKLSDYEGKVVFLEFMSIECPTCQKLNKHMKDAYAEYKDDIVMISVDVEQKETASDLRSYADEKGSDWIFAFPKDHNVAQTTFSVEQIPKVYIIDKDGYVTYEGVGDIPTSELKEKISAAKSGMAPRITIYSQPLIILAFAAGIASFFSPCSFPMLPGYVGYYLGKEEQVIQEQERKKEIMKKALPTGIAAAFGIIFVYLLLGTLIMIIGAPIYPYITILAPIAAIFVIILGIFMLTNYQYYFITDRVNKLMNAVFSRIKFKEKTLADKINENELGGIFAYGMGYGFAAAGCTLPIFLLIITGALSTGGFLSGMLMFLVYGLGAAIFMVAVTLLVATSKDSILNKMKMSTHKIKVISGLFMIVAGIALLAGFYIVFMA